MQFEMECKIYHYSIRVAPAEIQIEIPQNEYKLKQSLVDQRSRSEEA